MDCPIALSIDRAKLLAPISSSVPAGELLRYEGTYDRIQEARRQDDPALTMGVWEHDLKEADWQRVAELCTESLETRTKDLQIAAWLMESWLHLYGFTGAREGLTLIKELCVAFWKALHPPLEDPDYRLSIFQWMNEKLSVQLKFIPISSPGPGGNAGPYSFADWEKASLAEERGRKGAPTNEEPASEKDEATIAKFQQSVALTPPAFLEFLSEALASVTVAAVGLEAFLDQQYGKDAPTLKGFREIPEAIQAVMQQMVGSNRPATTTKTAAPSGETAAEEAETQKARAAAPTAPGASPIRSRAEAYQRLAEAAEYLFRTEPHSPTPYLVRKAISWGNMPLDELLPELVRNESALQETMKLLRIDPVKKAGEETNK